MTLYCSIAIPIRLPLLNVQLRTHWSNRGAVMRNLAWELKLALLAEKIYVPKQPFTKARVHVVRHSVKQPDKDNLEASVKGLGDILQPISKRHPYGLGIIANDSPDCLTLTIEHRKSNVAQTDIDIEDLSP